MRIWKGKEREGSCIKETLFIESRVLSNNDLKTIVEIAKREGINRLYFGAGGVNVIAAEGGYRNLWKDFEVVVETSDPLLLCAALFKKAKIILRLPVSDAQQNIIFKLDDGHQVKIFEEAIVTNIDEIKDGLYKTDTLLYEK